ncbi:hypothetical protein Pfo_001203 [Paulownia fortunei]|nr:hypothetical protein Pfo_001203 [Paulownia fortunei]
MIYINILLFGAFTVRFTGRSFLLCRFEIGVWAALLQPRRSFLLQLSLRPYHSDRLHSLTTSPHRTPATTTVCRRPSQLSRSTHHSHPLLCKSEASFPVRRLAPHRRCIVRKQPPSSVLPTQTQIVVY